MKNRVAMAPLTRDRAAPGRGAPRAIKTRYDARRAGAGLIVTVGSQMS